MTTAADDLVKMSELARRSGVPAPTIKHYMRLELLPGPSERTGRNMAWYDPAMVPRIMAIKELQRSRFLPLDVIKQVLDGADKPRDNERVAAAVARVLEETERDAEFTAPQLVAMGVDDREIRALRRMGLIEPREVDGQLLFSGADVELLETIKTARALGLSPDMLPVSILVDYIRAIQTLVQTELMLFRKGVLPLAGERVDDLAEVATRLSERLVVLLRRKMLLPTLRQLFDDAGSDTPREDKS